MEKRRKLETTEHTTGVAEAPQLCIQNVVSTFFLGCKNLNLKQIASRLKFLEFNPHKFGKHKKKKTTKLYKHSLTQTRIFHNSGCNCSAD